MKHGTILLLIFHSTFAYRSYTGYTLLRSIPIDHKHVDFLKNISQEIKMDFWRPPGAVNKPVDILVAPEEKKRLVQSSEANGYYFTTVMENVQRAFDKQTIKSYVRRKMSSFDFKNFFQLGDIYNWLIDLSYEKPEEVEIIRLGETYEKRDILAVKIVLKGNKRRNAVVMEGGIHAREWISPAFVCYMINQVINANQSDDMEMKNLSLLYEWYFVPILNPDGYAYTFEHDRLWRKNRRAGYGVDINRNFDAAFGSTGVSKHTTDETYCGSFAFSEKESLAMKGLIDMIQDRVEYYFAFHSYGQYMILPYAHLREHKDNYEEMMKILSEVIKKIAEKYGTHYISGTAFDTVGAYNYVPVAVETAGCWGKEAKTFTVKFSRRSKERCGDPRAGSFLVQRLAIAIQRGNAASILGTFGRYVATFELRDSGVHGFALPPDKILPTCEETLDGLKVILAPKAKQSIKYNANSDNNRKSRLFIDFVLGLFAIVFFVVECLI